MAHWLMKSEPDAYGWDDLVREGEGYWDGVRNPTAALHMKAMKKGDQVLFYHSNVGLEAVGVMEVSGEAEPDRTDKSGRWVAVRVKPVKPLPRPVSLKAIKLGGIRGMAEAGKLCDSLGMNVNISCKTGESSVACAAALHVASVIPGIGWALTLTHTGLAEDVTAQPLPTGQGYAESLDRPGLGVDVDEDRVSRLPIEIGLRERGIVEVTQGLAPGTRIVSAGTHKVSEGVQIEISTDPLIERATSTPPEGALIGEGT